MTIELAAIAGIASAEAAFELDGEAKPELNMALLSLSVDETIEGLYRCEARFGNWGSHDDALGYRFFDRSLLDFGKEIRVRLGSGDAEGEVFCGKISAIEGQFSSEEPPSVAILAEDSLEKLRTQRRSRSFADLSDSDIFQQIANDHGLQSEIDVQGPSHKIIAQLNQSDLAFIRERAWQLAAEVWLEGGKLFVKSRNDRSSDSDDFSLQFGRGLQDFSVIADTANQFTKVLVTGWDVSNKDRLEHEASAQIMSSELQGDTSGASIVENAFGNRIDRIVQQQPINSEEVQYLAEAAFRQQARRFVVGHGSAQGDARIRVGRKINFTGLGDMFSGKYIVTEARHIFRRGADGGYMSEFVVERPSIGGS